jgi:predicted DNA-binding transcriptional regulator AlpA
VTNSHPDVARLGRVAQILGTSSVTVRKLIRTDPSFPPPRLLGSARVWLVSEITAYLAGLPTATVTHKQENDHGPAEATARNGRCSKE